MPRTFNYFTFIGLLTAQVLLSSSLTSCAYRFGYVQRDLPGGYKEVAIPVFKNTTQQVGVEAYFTNALVRQFARSQVAKVAPKETSPVSIVGTVSSIQVLPGGQIDANVEEENETIKLPDNTVLTVEYRVLLKVDVKLIRNSDQKLLWSGNFDNERVYTAPQVGLSVINSVNPLYNHSARLEVIEQMSHDMMAEAHDRMTENF